MTALTQFDRLEAPGVWRPAPGARLRDVVVAFGDATLILRDGTRQMVALRYVRDEMPAPLVVATVSPCATSRAVAVSNPERCICQLSWSSTTPEYIA